jgi:hypothetical protein
MRVSINESPMLIKNIVASGAGLSSVDKKLCVQQCRADGKNQ